MKVKRFFNPDVDDDNWQALFNTHFQDLQSLNAISTMWISGFSRLGIDTYKKPTADELTAAIAPYTAYTFIQTDEHLILEQRAWYDMISKRSMPLTCFLRTPEELSYCDEPDIWHDIMGHIPFLAHQEYSDMYQLLARTYNRAYDEERNDLLPELDFIGGMIIELGLIKESNSIKAFGSTFYSSSEVFEAFKPHNQIPFTMDALQSGETYDRHSFQGKYYIIDSIDHLVSIILDIEKRL